MKISHIAYFIRFLMLIITVFMYSDGLSQSSQASYSQGDSIDGRFTLGKDKTSLLFGYPFDYSSSHFIIKCNGLYGSNNPNFLRVRYLQGYTQNLDNNKSPYGLQPVAQTTSYKFHGLDIKQELRPLNAQMDTLKPNEKASFYKLSYDIYNRSETEREVSFALMLDFMLGKEDAFTASSPQHNLHIDKVLKDNAVPDFIEIRSKNKQKNAFLYYQNAKKEWKKPDLLSLGQWAYLTSVLDLSAPIHTQYTDDTALMQYWEDKIIPIGERITLHCIIGGGYFDDLTLQYHQPRRKQEEVFYFESGQSDFSDENITKLNEFIGTSHVKAVLIEGFTDKVGSEKRNLALSKQRIEKMSYHLQLKGIKPDKILTKSHGEFFATDYEDADKNTASKTKNDRKVVLTIWR
ncbi:MAG: OmpA family protein [Bernardetiaceae bacterium]|nr:OmpA family protein [Bernardetiaceae bacterium]